VLVVFPPKAVSSKLFTETADKLWRSKKTVSGYELLQKARWCHGPTL